MANLNGCQNTESRVAFVLGANGTHDNKLAAWGGGIRVGAGLLSYKDDQLASIHSLSFMDDIVSKDGKKESLMGAEYRIAIPVIPNLAIAGMSQIMFGKTYFKHMSGLGVEAIIWGRNRSESWRPVIEIGAFYSLGWGAGDYTKDGALFFHSPNFTASISFPY